MTLPFIGAGTTDMNPPRPASSSLLFSNAINGEDKLAMSGFKAAAVPRYLRALAGLPLKVARGGSRKTSFTCSSLSTTTTKLN